ncbi:hypothetical protein PoB_002675500 [Plakobranchus ocellatus]|uniref:Uncharacterized protein n=1 Tax=Plakobranchus ocellatus TaxID=259542 RepID=A0AAV3ZWK5_9GAST|nr:hypothetical protein PoB_002675500 [Plakobranchus ocellatus]
MGYRALEQKADKLFIATKLDKAGQESLALLCDASDQHVDVTCWYYRHFGCGAKKCQQACHYISNFQKKRKHENARAGQQ